MDFTKFVSMLEDESLFFCRADCFEDSFEGSYSRANEKMRPEAYGELYGKISEPFSKFSKWIRQWTLINCWHMNEYESAAMWRLYARSNEAICIQSTFENLRQCLDENTYIGEVQYIDYNVEFIPEDNTFNPFLHKRKSFEHERELRAITQNVPSSGDSIDLNATPSNIGILKKVNLNDLIESVYVAPTSPKWFSELVKKVTDRYGLKKQVIQSSLDEMPFY